MFITVFGGVQLYRHLKTSNSVLLSDSKAPNDVGQFQLSWTNSKINTAGAVDSNDKSIFVMNSYDNKIYNESSNTGGGGHATYQLVFNMGGSEAAPAGAIQIKIPRYLYYGRDGKPIANQVIDIPLVDYPNEGGTGFNWRYEKDDDGNDWIILENNQETSASYTFECSITWILVTPSDLADGYEKEIVGEITVDLDQDGEIDMQSTSNTLTFKNKSHAVISSHYESYNTHRDVESGKYVNIYDKWNDNWSPLLKPEDSDEWVYAIWTSYTYVYYATQPYEITFNSEPIDDLGGEVIGYCRYGNTGSSSSSYNSYDNECFSKNVTETSQVRGYGRHKASTEPLKAIVDVPNSSTNGSYDYFMYYYYMVKYPKSVLQDGETHTLKNKTTANLVGKDGAKDSKSATAQIDYKYVYIEPTDVEVMVPAEIPQLSGALYDDTNYYGSYTDDMCGRCSYNSRYYHSSYAQMDGALNTLANSDSDYKVRLGGNYIISRNWMNYGYLQLYGLTYSGEGETSDIENYGVKKYTYNLVNEDFLASAKDDNNYVKLEYGDYELTSFYVHDYYNSIYKYDEWQSYNESTKVTTHYKGYRSVTDTNYSNYPLINIYIKTDGDWKLFGKIKTTSSNSYKFIDEDDNEKNINENNQISLPEGTTGIKASYDTNSYTTSLYLEFKAKLINSDRIQELYKDSNSLYVYNVNTLYASQDDNIYSNSSYGYSLKNNFKSNINKLDQERYGTTNIAHEYDYMLYTRINGGSTSQGKSVTYKNDVLNRRVVANYTAYAYEYRSFSNEVLTADEIYDYKIINEQKVGTFYDLLPIGVSADLNSIKVVGYNTNVNIPVTASVKTNWQGTGRDMLIVKAKVDDDKNNRYNQSNATYSGMTLTFKAYYEWDSISDYGTYLVNTIAYKSGSGKLSNGYADDSSSISESTIKDKAYMSDLDQDGNPEGTIKDTVYAQAGLSFAFNTASDASFRKGVKTANMTEFVDGHDGSVVATAGGYYTYQLRYQSQKNMKTTGLVIYDNLETYDDKSGNTWKGTFVDINVLQPELKGIKPVVYYSTNKNINFYENGKATIDRDPPKITDLTDESVWSTEPPEDLSRVTAIAIDLTKDKNGNDFTLQSEESVTMTVTMKAPVENALELEKNHAKALNCAWWLGTTQQGGESPHLNFSVYEWTEVLIRDVQVSIDKKSHVESGSKSKPKTVQKGDKIIYDVIINNDSDYESFSDVYVTDMLPDSVKVHPDYFAYYKDGEGSIDNYKLMSEDGAIEYSSNDDYKTIDFKIKQLLAGDVVHILIPVTVTTNKEEVIENQAKLLGFNDNEYVVLSATTYHSTNSASISISKKVDTKYENVTYDESKKFKFKITLIAPSLEEVENEEYALTAQIENLDLLNTKYGDVKFVDGVGEFSLSAGETVNLYNLPIGYGYKIEEEDYSSEGYSSKIENAEGIIGVNQEIKVVATNTYLLETRNPETSVSLKILLVLSTIWIVSLFLLSRKRKIKIDLD